METPQIKPTDDPLERLPDYALAEINTIVEKTTKGRNIAWGKKVKEIKADLHLKYLWFMAFEAVFFVFIMIGD
jgi:hypothetical protein